VWSKVGSFVEGLHIVGDILTKISDNCVIKFTCCIVVYVLIFMGYHMCGYNCVYFYGYFLYMLHVYVYCYFSVNLFIYRCICMFMFYI